MAKFKSRIYKIGINPVIDPPDFALAAVFAQAGVSKGPIPVRGFLNGAEFVQTLVKFRGAWRLYINGPMLKASGLQTGDVATVGMEFDPRPRDIPMPEKFAEALKQDPKAAAEFKKLAPSRQKEILRYLSALKTGDAVKRNVRRVMLQLKKEGE